MHNSQSDLLELDGPMKQCSVVTAFVRISKIIVKVARAHSTLVIFCDTIKTTYKLSKNRHLSRLSLSCCRQFITIIPKDHAGFCTVTNMEKQPNWYFDPSSCIIKVPLSHILKEKVTFATKDSLQLTSDCEFEFQVFEVRSFSNFYLKRKWSTLSSHTANIIHDDISEVFYYKELVGRRMPKKLFASIEFAANSDIIDWGIKLVKVNWGPFYLANAEEKKRLERIQQEEDGELYHIWLSRLLALFRQTGTYYLS